MSELGTVYPGTELGTLVWIGDQSSPEFREPFQYSVSHAAQVAPRRDLDEALCRPAASVRCIVIEQDTRRAVDGEKLDHLKQLYPQASILLLRGALCDGIRSLQQPILGLKQIGWHRWNQVLPQWLAPCGPVQEPPHQGGRSVAVLASTLVAAEPLMDLAESAGVTAVWCRNPDRFLLRNFDTVWWDDSVAGPASQSQWRARITAFRGAGSRSTHAWIANSPRYEDHCQAKRGGIDIIVTKPHRIECLLETLASTDQGQATASHAALRVA